MNKDLIAFLFVYLYVFQFCETESGVCFEWWCVKSIRLSLKIKQKEVEWIWN